MPWVSFNLMNQPLKSCTGEWAFTQRKIFHHQLPTRSQQPLQPRKRCQRLWQVMQRICTRDKIKGFLFKWETCCLTSADLDALQMHMRLVLQGNKSLRKHVFTGINS